MIPALAAYVELLTKWNATINLVSAADMPLLETRHIADSLQLGSVCGPLPSRLIDMGSGAGFPGLVLAIVFGIEVDLIERDQRKAAFLREAVFVTGAPARVHATMVEKARVAPAPLVVSRALAPLPMLLRFAHPLLLPDGFCLFPKSGAVDEEIARAERDWTMRLTRFASTTDPGAVILRVDDVRPKG